MRGVFTGTLFVLALVLAACGGGAGGGKSSLLPAAGATPGNNTPASAKSTSAKMVFYVPPANKQNARSKPLYISSATQAFAIYVEPYPSVAPTGFPSPQPTGIQVFPVTTPSPCAVASGGGETCTFTVTAPIGTDLFVVAALPTATLGPNTTPLSAYLSGPVTVSLSPAPSASPLSFTLNGVVYSAAIAVASPDPNNTPNTQVFTALVPTSAPLGITAYDANNNVVMSPATQPFFAPIVINASPSADGVTLSLVNTSQCGSAASAAQASIACAGDLNDVLVTYDGSTHPDSTDHAIGNFAIVATAQPNPSPSPANIVLASNLVVYPVETGTYTDGGFLLPITGGQLLYAYNGSTPMIGTFTPSTATASTPVTLSTIDQIGAMAVAPNGALWAVDEDGDAIDCWSSVSSATSSAAPVVTGIAPLAPDENTLSVYAITVDGENNLWFVGEDSETGANYAGYWPASGGCPSTAPAITAQFALSGDSYDTSTFAAPLANGMAYDSYDDGFYEMTTSSTSPISVLTPALGAGSYGGGVAVDPAGNAYAAFRNYESASADLEWNNGGSLASLLTLVPTNNSVGDLEASPYGLAVFSSTNATADRAAYPDNGLEAFGLVENLHATPTTLVAALSNAFSMYQTAYGTNGQVYILYLAYNNSTEAYALNIARAVTTTTWAAPVTSVSGGGCAAGGLLSINERGDSGPFTVVASPSSSVTMTELPGSDHDYLAAPEEGSATVQLTITDVNGRQMIVPSFTTAEGEDC
jgi:hypothetical protein